MKKNKGFTLAEVLLTLGIIGVVITLTIPSLVANNKKQTAALNVKKFYYSMDQVLSKYLLEKNMLQSDFRLSSNLYDNGAGTQTWFNNNLKKYLKAGYSTLADDGKSALIYLDDGTVFYLNAQSSNKLRFTFCPKVKECRGEYIGNPKSSFIFEFSPENGFISGTSSSINSTRTNLINDCKKKSSNSDSCARLIQVDGWKIKSDYPW